MGDSHRGFIQTATQQGALDIHKAEAVLNAPSTEAPEQLPLLVAYLTSIWDANRRGKETIQTQMLDNLRAYRNEYSAEKKSAIAQEGGAEVFMGLTRTKCRHGISWLMDIFTSAEKPWLLEPSPDPDPTEMARARVLSMVQQDLKDKMTAGAQEGQVTPELMQETLAAAQPMAEEAMDIELKDRARKMDKLVHDQLLEGGFFKEFRKSIRDLVILKGGIIKGPVPRKVEQHTWVSNAEGTEFTRETKTVTKPYWYSISPFDLYPDSTASDDEAPMVERMRLLHSELAVLKTEPGYFKEAINKILLNFEKYAGVDDGEEPSDATRADLEEREDETQSSPGGERAVAKEFSLKVPGTKLKEYSDTESLRKIPGAPAKIDPTASYFMNVILVGKEVIFMKFDKDPIDRVKYYKYGWDEVNGSFWYEGVPETMCDLQRVCNAAARALVNNMGIASGPMAEIDVDRLLPGEDLEGIKPFRLFQTVGKGAGQAPAVRFFSPDSNASELLKVYDSFAKLADEYTGIPAYSYGNDRVAGAGRTMGGLSMLMSAAARGIKEVVLGLDDNVIKPLVQAQVDWNMKYHKDNSVKGDLRVVSSGAVAIMVREQMSEKRMEFLEKTNNPTDIALIGPEGRANVLREAVRSLELAATTIVKTPEEVRDQVATQEEAQRAAEEQEQQLNVQERQLEMSKIQADIQKSQIEAEVKKAQLQIEAAKLELEKARLQMEVGQADAKIKLSAAELGEKTKAGEADRAVKGMDASLKTAEFMEKQFQAEDAANQPPEDEGGGVPPTSEGASE